MLQTINNNDLIPFNFEGVKLQEACWMNGAPYFTRKAIGEFLEYKYPREAINKIVQRNLHVNDDRWSTEVKLTPIEGGREVTRDTRVYDPIGLQLIIFESRQPKAIQYKIAVAHLVYAYMKGEIRPSRWTQKGDRVSAIKQILSHPSGHPRAQLIKDLAAREEVRISTAYEWISHLGKLKTKAGIPKRERTDTGTTKYPELRDAALFVKSQMPTYGPQRIAVIIGKPGFKNNVKRWVKAA